MKFTDLLSKLSSRKFWAMVAAVVVSVLAMFHYSEETLVQITSLVTSVGAIITYIIGESSIDKSNKKEDNSEQEK
jgi:amino acid transporter